MGVEHHISATAFLAGLSISSPKESALARLRINDVSPDAVTLALAAGGAPLDPRLSIADAIAKGMLSPRTDLLVMMDAIAQSASRRSART